MKIYKDKPRNSVFWKEDLVNVTDVRRLNEDFYIVLVNSPYAKYLDFDIGSVLSPDVDGTSVTFNWTRLDINGKDLHPELWQDQHDHAFCQLIFDQIFDNINIIPLKHQYEIHLYNIKFSKLNSIEFEEIIYE